MSARAEPVDEAARDAGPPGDLRPSWCEIDLDAIDHNIRQLRSLVSEGVRIFACMKSDAMGCGAQAVALQCQASGVDGLAFGNVDSAIACRRAGVRLPILLYPSCLPSTAPALGEFDLMPTISTLDDVRGWSARATRRLGVFLKIDLGGFRAGAFPSDALYVARAISESPMLDIRGIYGHVMSAYGDDRPELVRAQADAFRHAIASVARAGNSTGICMLSSSATVLSNPELDFDAVDPGRLLIGLDFAASPERERVWRQPLVSIRSRIVMSKSTVNADVAVAVTGIDADRTKTIGLLPMGWSDGWPSLLPKGATVLVNGVRCAVVGPVHSELIRIDLSNAPATQIGDEAVILGCSGQDEITLEELRHQWGVSAFDIYVGITKRLPKTYLRSRQ